MDHNSLKNASIEKAARDRVKTMKLPIQQHVSLKSSAVLSVNSIFQIIHRMVNGVELGEAIRESIPKRKQE